MDRNMQHRHNLGHAACIYLSLLHIHVHDAFPFCSMPIVAKFIIFSIIKLLEAFIYQELI